MSPKSANVKSVILCDDLRTEYTGKHIIIGIYGPELGVASFPNRMAFKAVMVIDFPSGGDFEIKLRVLDSIDEIVGEASIEVTTFRSGGNVVIPGMDFTVEFSKPGDFKIQSMEGTWKTCGTWVVNNGQTPINPTLQGA